MKPLRCVLPAIILIFNFTIVRALSGNATTHTDNKQVWEVRHFYPNLLGQTNVELQTWRAVTALICGALAAALSSAGGLGGGGLYVPIFNLLLGFNSKTSAALSSCMIVGGTLVNLVWYSLQRRADGLGPLIDYQVALLCLPNVLLGISAGVLCNVASPSWLVTVLLIIVLVVMTFRSCSSACQRWSIESAALQGVVNSSVPEKHTSREHVVTAHVYDSLDDDAEKTCKNGELEKPLLGTPEVKRLRQYPPLKIAMLCIIWVVFLAIQIVRGSSDGQNFFGVQTCGAIYWIMTVAQVPFALVVTACALVYLQKKSGSADMLEDGDLQEDTTSGGLVTVWLPIYTLGAGLLGGMLGLGGGTIISPLLLELGMHPQVAAATCSFMVFFSSSLSVIQFWLLGRIPEQYALVAAALSLVFSVIGLQVVQRIIAKYGRVSLIVFAVGIVMGISAAFMGLFGSWEVLMQIEQGEYMGFRSPC